MQIKQFINRERVTGLWKKLSVVDLATDKQISQLYKARAEQVGVLACLNTQAFDTYSRSSAAHWSSYLSPITDTPVESTDELVELEYLDCSNPFASAGDDEIPGTIMNASVNDFDMSVFALQTNTAVCHMKVANA